MSRPVVIFADEGAWRIGLAPHGAGPVSFIDVPFSPDDRVNALIEAVKSAGIPKGAGVVLAIASRDCLCAPIDTSGLPSRNRGQAMLYRFEEKLPVAAEEINADFIAAGGVALGVGIETRVLDPLVAAVNSAGLRLRAVCPAALLALQNVRSTELNNDELVLWADGAGAVEIHVMSGGVPVAWYHVPDDPADVAMHVRAALLGRRQDAKVTAIGVRAEVLAALATLGVPVTPTERIASYEAAAETARLVVAGKRQPWVELGGAEAKGIFGNSGLPVRWAAAAIILFTACLFAALFYRAWQYDLLATRYENEKARVFHEALPDQAVPADVWSRLASEARSRESSPQAGSAREAAGLVILRDVMTFLPLDTRFRVTDVRLDGPTFVLEGEVNSHGDAEAIAGALRRRTGFRVEPPRTEQRGARGVAFTITGSATSERGDSPERRASR